MGAAMALSFQQQSRRRKFTYAGVIVLLFTVMLVHRQAFVEAAAEKHSLRETNIGKVDLGGSAARFALASFRGPLVCAMWWESLDLKERGEWQKYQLQVQAITKLQPHFQRPWLYLAWDLAYNIGGEFDAVADKYHYVAEGVLFLVEGEQVMRWTVFDPRTALTKTVGDPRMRWEIGYTIMNRLTMSDERRTYACLLPLSCIPPDIRDPAALRANPQRLNQFKADYPNLVRHIRELRHVPEGAEAQADQEVLAFLRTYRDLPSRYEKRAVGQGTTSDVIPSSRPFPVWPREMDRGAGPSARRTDTHLESEQDPHEIAFHWAVFSQEPLPPPTRDLIPREPTKTRLYRLPTGSLYIFRGHPARYKGLKAIAYGADGRFEDAQRAWRESHEQWRKFGMENGLVPYPGQLQEWEAAAQLYRNRYPDLAVNSIAPPLSDLNADPELRKSYEAQTNLFWFHLHRHTAHFNHWEIVSLLYQTDKATEAWRRFYLGKTSYRTDPLLARRAYEQGAELWIDLLTDPLHPQRDLSVLLGVGPDVSLCGGLTVVVAANLWRGLLGISLFVPERHLGPLLAMGPAPVWPAAAVLPRTGLLPRSRLGRDKQVQRDVAGLQRDYLDTLAKCLAPDWVKAGPELWDALPALAALAASPVSPGPVVHGVAASAIRPPLEYYEAVLQEVPGPFDWYIEADIRAQTARQARGVGSIYQMSRPAETGRKPDSAP